METFFIISKDLYQSTDWKASDVCNVAPAKIYQGIDAGKYAVNTAIFDSDPSFEKFRNLLESQSVKQLQDIALINPETN